jgi:hypothetical protein
VSKITFNSNDLGMDGPYINRMSLHGCAADQNDPHFMEDSGKWSAHTHICIKDPARGLICFAEPRLALIRKFRLHEYAHLIEGGRDFLCPHNKNQFLANFDEIQRSGHNDRWKKIMRDLDQTVPWYYG